MKIDLSGNVKSIGPVFFTLSKDKAYSRRLVQRVVTVETEEPWHRGRGWGLLLLPGVLLGLGTWRPDEDQNREVEAREVREIAHTIPDWRIAFRIEMDEEPRPSVPDGWSIIPMEKQAS